MILRIGIPKGLRVSSTRVSTWAIAFVAFSLASLVSGGGEAGAVPQSEAAAGGRTVTVNTGSFDLTVRSAPSATSQKIGSIADHSKVVITCYARGVVFSGGPYHLSTDLWNRLQSGGYVTDAMLDTGSNDPVVPPCETESTRLTTGRAVGRKAQNNPGRDGTDMWAAFEKWYFVSGKQFYPAVGGAPKDLAGAARSSGWSVVGDPQSRAIVVIPPGVLDAPAAGHVAWVDTVSKRTDGTYLRITEMGGPGMGPGTWSARDVKAQKGLSYVLLP